MERLPARAEIHVRRCRPMRRRPEIESSIRRRDRYRIIREWALYRQDVVFGTDTGAAQQLYVNGARRIHARVLSPPNEQRVLQVALAEELNATQLDEFSVACALLLRLRLRLAYQ